MSNLDIRDLALIDALTRTCNISAAAEILGLSQPSVSIRLAKLRTHFNDALFVRTRTGMQPTPRVAELLPAIRSALGLLADIEEGAASFDPLGSNRIFRLSMTSTGQVVVIARLKNVLNRLAPKVRIEVIDFTEQTPLQLERGEVDIAMGFTTIMGSGFYQQKLFREHYVCLIRRNHARINHELTIEQFKAEGHVAVKSSGTAHWLLEKAIDDAGISRNIELWVPSFLGLADIVRTTDLLALAPVHLAQIICRDKTVRRVDVPIEIPSYDVKQYWHERYHQEPGNRWLRQVIADVIQEN